MSRVEKEPFMAGLSEKERKHCRQDVHKGECM